jgi:hypothetical protein
VNCSVLFSAPQKNAHAILYIVPLLYFTLKLHVIEQDCLHCSTWHVFWRYLVQILTRSMCAHFSPLSAAEWQEIVHDDFPTPPYSPFIITHSCLIRFYRTSLVDTLSFVCVCARARVCVRACNIATYCSVISWHCISFWGYVALNTYENYWWWIRMIVTYFKVLSWLLPGETDKTVKT